MQELKDLELRALPMFTGTTVYYRVWLNFLVTEGVKYVMENGYSWFITDALSVIHTKGWRDRDFLTVKLKLKGMGAVMVIEDGDGKTLYTQKYSITDAKRELTLFYSYNVLMLSSEY